MKRNSGFTLIELVIVIIVLGILAATAVPKFINLQDDAKNSALRGVEAAIHSAANITYSKSAIEGTERTLGKTDGSVSAAGVTTTYGYPDSQSTGIENAVELSGVTASSETAIDGAITFHLDGTAVAGCTLIYTPAKTSGGDYQVWYSTVSGSTATSSATPTCGG
jgi:MSHA pilin protein MshA